MAHSSASGERAALRGFGWQYDHIAARIYDAILDGDFTTARLTDPEVGQVDDLVLVRGAHAEGYQFKSARFTTYVSFQDLLKDQHTRSGRPAPGLVAALAHGWLRLRERGGKPHVHLVMQHLASVNDHLPVVDQANRPSPDHFSAFCSEVLTPLQSGSMSSSDVPPAWGPAMLRLRDASGLPDDEFDEFLRALHLDLGAVSPLSIPPSVRREDLISLADALFRKVANSTGVVELDQHAVLDLVGWTQRNRLRSRHEFPVDLDTYSPLQGAIQGLSAELDLHDSGYLAVVGPIGAGKSTLLNQALTGRADRVVRYYAYVPGTAPGQTRMSAAGFLHDIVLMLLDSGLPPMEHQLVSDDILRLRQQFVDLLDAAGAEYASTSRRTILVVDGLDHVDRDYQGNDGLLAELPDPRALPNGVIVVAGSRTLGPLHAFARQQVEERAAIVDLGSHPLTTSAVLDVCRHAPLTAQLSEHIHQRIAALCAGHPLALSYLLNRLREADDDEDPETVLARAPAYDGDIAAEYRAAWDALEDDAEIIAILSVCARLRVGFSTDWLGTWASTESVSRFRRRLLYLFRQHHDGWRFFHDSFRQFAADRTALGDTGVLDVALDSAAHARAAERCAASTAPHLAAEELYHRYCAGDTDMVLRLGQQRIFREQYHTYRAPEAIRSDIGLTLECAARSGDVPALLRMLLALAETDMRTSALENVDMPGLLYECGLVDGAVGYCGGEIRRVPLAQAYNLATRLGRAADPAGRRIFDVIEHDGLDDPGRGIISGHEDDAARGWVRAAVLFRPLQTVLDATTNAFDTTPHAPSSDYERSRRRERYRKMMRAVIDTLAERGDAAGLLDVDSSLAELCEQIALPVSPDEDRDAAANDIATIIHLRVLLHGIVMRFAVTAEVAEEHLERLLSLVRGVPTFTRTLLLTAEIAASNGATEVAKDLIVDSPYAGALSVRELSSTGESGIIDLHFRYWRLRHLLAQVTVPSANVPESIRPSTDTPAGEDVVRGAAVHSDEDAIDLAERIDAAVRTLARLDAASRSGNPVWANDIWTSIVPMLDVFRRPTGARRSATLSIIRDKKLEFMRLLVMVAVTFGDGIPQRLSDLLSRRFREEPDQWMTAVRLELAELLQSNGVEAGWYADALADEEAKAAAEDLYSRLENTAALVSRYAADGDIDDARRLLQTLIPMAFGVGYRKDYQFDAWVAWLRRAIGDPGGEALLGEATWLTRVMVAAEPMTEGELGSAATALPPGVAVVAPLAAVRIFEYVVRHGTADHMDALADLVGGLVSQLSAGEHQAVELAANLTAEVIAAASSRAYPDLAEAIASAAHRVFAEAPAASLIESVAARTDVYALPTKRAAWRSGLGLALDDAAADIAAKGEVTTSNANDYGALILSGGRRFHRSDVSAHLATVEDIIAFRTDEAAESSFAWARIVDAFAPDMDSVRALGELFEDGTERGGDVLAVLAERAESLGDSETASRLAVLALQQTSSDSWSNHYGGAHRRAAAVVVRNGGPSDRVAVCQDLVAKTTRTPWFAGLLLSELADIVSVLEPGISAKETWPYVREYLDGVAMTLALPQAEVLDDWGARWWLSDRASVARSPATEVDRPTAVAELLVDHLAHPTWVVRDGATRAIAHALSQHDESVAATLARFAPLEADDEILELAGRCLAAARLTAGFSTPECLKPLESTLAAHRSGVLRDLAPDHIPVAYRALPAVYRLSLPAPLQNPIGSTPTLIAPHEAQYRMLADYLALDLDTLVRIAELYAREVSAAFPSGAAVRAALESEHVQHVWPLPEIAMSRAAFGRVLADVTDAELLINAPAHIARRLRTIDIPLLTQQPCARPAVVPPPPAAGHDQTIERWLADIDQRLDEYVNTELGGDRILIGAIGYLTVLNWGHLEEEVTCGTVVGNAPGVPALIVPQKPSMLLADLSDTGGTAKPGEGEPIVVSNVGWTLHQINADWVALRPDVASGLGWTADSRCRGDWHTARGELAVEALWWVDGWWGRAGPDFDDTEATGHAVCLTRAGLAELTAALGPVTRHFTLKRWGKGDQPVEGADATPSVATRSSPAL